MTHFLFKPHVTGPTDDITTPDVLIDRVSLLDGPGDAPVPVHRLLSAAEMQWPVDEISLTPLAALVACGGGVLLSFGVSAAESGERIARSDVVIARSAWRLRNVVDHIDTLQLILRAGDEQSTISVTDLLKPAVVKQQDGDEFNLPRGIMRLGAGSASTVSVPANVSVAIADSKLGRRLTQTLRLVSANTDSWNERPLPRYTVGPVGDVKHYI